MIAPLPTFAAFEKRRKALGISRPALARRAGVSLATVKRVLSGHETPSLYATHAIASALGMQVSLGSNPSVTEAVDAREFRRAQALCKARRLAKLVQGTMALEAQAIDSKALEGLVEDNVHKLLSGSSRRLWDE